MTEDLRTCDAAAVVEEVDNNNGEEIKPTSIINAEKKTKKRGGPFGIFKLALFAMSRSSRSQPKKKLVVETDQTGENWKKLVGSIRPLHVPDIAQTPPTLSPSATVENLEDLVPHGSSCSFPSPSVYGGSSMGSMSQYASASNLQDLDDHNSDDEEDDPDEVFDAIRGDEMIDAKAEEFIAQFYQQMKLQHIE